VSVSVPTADFVLERLLAERSISHVRIDRIAAFDESLVPYLWMTEADTDTTTQALRADPDVGSFEVIDTFGCDTLVRVGWVPDATEFVEGLTESDAVLVEATSDARPPARFLTLRALPIRMTVPDSVAMDDDERDAFLGDGGTGVISFPTDGDEAPHSIPVSYGYDTAEETFYFRLAAGEGREKSDLLDRSVSFVTYGTTDGTWQSVVAEGRLEETTDASIATETLEGLERVRIPLVDIFGQPPADVPFKFYRLAPESLTARKESSTSV
jgi:nitroimidazol reductase NimA-like FMN-containing flavoprotein (pyridoxamine 5'-phosphate oxidase superfamily)